MHQRLNVKLQKSKMLIWSFLSGFLTKFSTASSYSLTWEMHCFSKNLKSCTCCIEEHIVNIYIELLLKWQCQYTVKLKFFCFYLFVCCCYCCCCCCFLIFLMTVSFKFNPVQANKSLLFPLKTENVRKPRGNS